MESIVIDADALADYKKLLDSVGKTAEANGLTEKILEELLASDDWQIPRSTKKHSPTRDQKHSVPDPIIPRPDLLRQSSQRDTGRY